MSLDLNADYKKVQDKVSATKSYTEAKKQYNSAKKKAGESFDDKKSDVTQSINKVKEQTKRFEKQIKNQFEQLLEINSEIVSQTEILLKYEGYISREEDLALKMSRMDERKIPDGVDYMVIPSLSIEARQKLTKLQPATVGQASRVSGVSPSDIAVLLIHIGR